MFCHLRGALSEKGMTQHDLAVLLHVSDSDVSKKFCGRLHWTMADIYSIMKILNLPLESIPEYFPNPIK